MLGLAWSPQDGSYLYAAGDKQLSLLKRADGFSQSFSSNIVHDKEITIVLALSTNCLLTAGLDKRIKIWQTQKTDLSDATLEHTIEVSQPITTLKYSAKN
jgi:WD40 repeat protein